MQGPRSEAEAACSAYLEQQSLAYSRIKNRFIAELLGDLRGKRFLDFGCGGGMHLVLAARAKAGFVLGADRDPVRLAGARLFLQREGVDGRVGLIRADSLDSLGPKGWFQAVLLKDVIEHLPDDRDCLAKAAGLLAPGGRLVLATQNSWSLNYLIEGGWNRTVRGRKNWYGWDPTHLRFYNPKKLAELLARAGLEITDRRSAYVIPNKFPAPPWSGKRYWRPGLLSWLDLVLGRIPGTDRLGWCMMVAARRI